MAEDINNVTLVGRLAWDPEMRKTNSGVSVCQVRLAFSTRAKDSSGEWGEKSNFITVVVFGRMADLVEQYVRKGERIGVTGRLEMNEWTAKDGQKRQQIQVVASAVQFLQPKGEPAQAPAGGGSSWDSAPGGPQDDDIPF